MANRINFSNVSDKFEPIPDGLYRARIKSYKVGKVANQSSENYGVTKYDLQFVIVEEATEAGNYQNRSVWRTYVISDKSLWAMKATCNAFGADVDWSDSEGVDIDELLDTLIRENAEANLELGINRYTKTNSDGSEEEIVNNKVNKVVSIEGGDIVAATAGANSRKAR